MINAPFVAHVNTLKEGNQIEKTNPFGRALCPAVLHRFRRNGRPDRRGRYAGLAGPRGRLCWRRLVGLPACGPVDGAGGAEDEQMRHSKWVFPNIEKWFGETNLTERAFAEKIGIYPDTFSKWMLGRHEPPLWGIRAILKETGMTFEEAFQEKETPPRDGNPESGKEKNP